MATSNPIKVVGYFAAWGIHAMKYQVANIPADRLTYVLDAFANFPQLLQPKQRHPNLATLISIRGPSSSDNFSKVAASADLQFTEIRESGQM